MAKITEELINKARELYSKLQDTQYIHPRMYTKADLKPPNGNGDLPMYRFNENKSMIIFEYQPGVKNIDGTNRNTYFELKFTSEAPELSCSKTIKEYLAKKGKNCSYIKGIDLKYRFNLEESEVEAVCKDLMDKYEFIAGISSDEEKNNVNFEKEEGDELKVQEMCFDRNMILYGPPGTGKTYHTVLYAVAIIEGRSLKSIEGENYSEVKKRYDEYMGEGRIAFTTFHQSYGYEEFIEGIRPVVEMNQDTGEENLQYEIRSGIFKSFCERAELAQKAELNCDCIPNQEPYVFVIDEINRGNISKIFGELITLIEFTKRIGQPEELCLLLPYSQKLFGIPDNVYIIGTMNTADRSIAMIDTALRRRFRFVEMMPDSSVLVRLHIDKLDVKGKILDIAKMLDIINNRISCLFDREHTIGHAFFTELVSSPTLECLAGIFEKSVIPLLQEYFYEDYGKIQLVLGDDGKSDEEYKFIKDEDIKSRDIFKGMIDIDLPEKRYSIQREAFYKIQSYLEIGQGCEVGNENE